MKSHSSAMRSFPGSTRLLLHPAAGRGARRIRTLAGASDWRRDAVDRIGAGLVAITGPQHLPIASTIWRWPDLGPDGIVEALQPALPGLRLIGAALPRQPDRRRLSLLCRYAGNPIVVKLGFDESAASLRVEADALQLLTERPLPGIATPDLIAVGSLQPNPMVSITFVATTAIGLTAQRPAIDVALRTFEADLAERLAPLAKPDGCPVDAAPIHGDLTPWNLRRTSRGLALFDWESAGWGARGSDVATYRLACDQVRPFWRTRR